MNKKQIIQELEIINDDLWKFPTKNDLKKLEKFNLIQEIDNLGLTLASLEKELYSYSEIRPKNYWNKSTLEKEIKLICEELGGWPESELWSKKYSSIKTAVYAKGFYLSDFKNKLGITNIAGNVKRPCIHCQKEFLPSIVGGNWKRQKFCSNDCLVNFHRIEQNKENALKIKQPKICPICSQEFTPNTTTKQKYCENNCFRKFRKRIGKALRRSFEAIGTLKQDISYKILGYTPEDLLKHLQSYPDWQKISNNKWDLDHIFPVKAFIDKNIFDPKLINCLDNLQPLPRKDNLSKADKYDSEAFEIWLKNKLNPS